MRTFFKSALSALVLGFAALSSGGCDLLTAGGGPNEGSPDCVLPTKLASGKESQVAIVVDVSRSTRSAAKDNEIPSYLHSLAPVVTDAVNDGARISIGSFAGPGTGVRWTRRDQPTASEMENLKNAERQKASIRTCMTDLLTETLNDAAVRDGTDVLNAVRAAADLLKSGGGGKKKLVVATDGLVTTGCADMTRTRFAGAAEIQAIVNVCKERKELKDTDLAGVEVSFIGIGRPGPDQPMASPEQLDWLRQLWEALCASGGGSACQVSTTDPGREPGSAASQAPTDPVVGFAAPWTFRVPGALFDTAKADLRNEAIPHLLGIAINIRTIPKAKVDVYGHADITGNAKDNLTLSVRRAESVRDFLSLNGVVNIFVHGYGDTRPKCHEVPPSDACLQENRRVEIIATKL